MDPYKPYKATDYTPGRDRPTLPRCLGESAHSPFCEQSGTNKVRLDYSMIRFHELGIRCIRASETKITRAILWK